MAVLGRLLLGSAERLDLPDLLSIDSFTAGDFKYLIQSFIGSDTPYTLKGFDVIQPQDSIGTEGISIRVADSVVYYPSSTAGSFFYGLEEGNENALPLVPELRKNATNYVYLTFTTFDTASDSRAFWDPDQNGGDGGEFSQDINTESVLQVEIGVSVSTFPEDTIPVCKVVVGSTVIESIEDSRDMMFRLGTGGVNPDPFANYNFRDNPSSLYARNEPNTIMTSALDPNPFEGGDKNIFTLKEWMDVVMTRFKEISGETYWYSAGSGSTGSGGTFNLRDTWEDALGSVLKSKGEWVSDESVAGRLEWTEDLIYHSLKDPRQLIIRSSTIDLANDGEVAYIQLDKGEPINSTSQTVTWTNGTDNVNGSTGAFENVSKGDWIKKSADGDYLYLRVDEFFTLPNQAGGATTPALAQSIKLSGNYAGTSGAALSEYTRGEYLGTDVQIDDRDDTPLNDLGGKLYWLAYRCDGVFGLESATPTQITVDITEADGSQAKCTSVGHGLEDSDRIYISTGGYIGEYVVSVEDSDIFYINTAVTGDELAQTGIYAIVETRARNTGFSYELESANHGIRSGQTVHIENTASAYDGSYIANVRSDTTFQIAITANTPNPGPLDTDNVRSVRMAVRTEFGAVNVVQGQTADVGNPDMTNILSYLGMPSLNVTAPDYQLPDSYNALNGHQNYNCETDDDITIRAAKLTAMMADRIQDRGLLFHGRVNIANATNALNQDITASGTIELHKPSSPLQVIDLTASLPANSVAVANIDRDGGSAITLTVESIGAPFLLEENKLIMFYRFSGPTVYTWRGEAIGAFGHVNTDFPEDSQNRNVFVFNNGNVEFDIGTGLVTLDMATVQQQTRVVPLDGSSTPQSSYFTINSALDVTEYYVWFDVDAGGTDPLVAGKTGIPVVISSANTTQDVSDAIVASINVNAGADFTATNNAGTSVTLDITNDAIGAATSAADVSTTFTVTTPIIGQDPDPEIIVHGAAATNTIDADTINGLGTLIIGLDQAAWVRISRFTSKTFNTILTADAADTTANGAIYITDISAVPIDQDVFVLWVRRGDNLLEMHKAIPRTDNVYDEFITVVSGAPVDDNEITGPVVSSTIIALPFDSRDSDNVQNYIVGAGHLEVTLNGQHLIQGEDWDEVGATSTVSNRIEILQDLVVDDRLNFRIDTEGSVYFASAGLTDNTLQDVYDNGKNITVNSGQPIVISGPAAEKLLRVLGDVEITGVLDPTGLELTSVASNPLAGGSKGIWVNTSDEMVYEGSRIVAAEYTFGSTTITELEAQSLKSLAPYYDSGNDRLDVTGTGGLLVSGGLTEVTSSSVSAPVVDVDNTAGAFVSSTPSGPGGGFQGQSFTINTSGDLSEIQVDFIPTALTGNMQLDIWSVDGGGLPDTLLGSSDVVLGTNLITGLNAFTFTSTISLIGGTKYAYVLNVDNLSGVLTFIESSPTNVYTDGSMLLSNGARDTWFEYGDNRDMRFEISLDAVVTGPNLRMTAATSGDVDWKLPVNVTSYDMTLPAAQGAVGTSLRNDGAGNLSWANAWDVQVVTGTANAENGDFYFADTTGGPYIINLPATPSTGDRVKFADHNSNWGTDTLTVGRNGENINGSAANIILNTNDGWAELVYTGDPAVGWRSIEP